MKLSARENRKRDRNLRSLGFTLIEVLVVLAMVGILSAIAAPSWLSFANNQRLSSAQSRAFSTLRLAQSEAKRRQTVWQASFRNMPDIAQYVVHRDPPSNANKAYWDNLPWQNFEQGVRIDDDMSSKSHTTFTPLTAVPDPPVYRAQFKSQGNPILSEKGQITFVNKVSKFKKCVIISTLLGAIRVAENTECNQT
jgi:prepilin-type N-terminal cleavage/methylation domain-containing protein